MKKPSIAAKKAKAKKLFILSHKLLDAARQLSEHHAAELKYNVQHAMDFAKISAQKDIKQLQVIQKKAADEASKRMLNYQKKAKIILKDITDHAAESAEKNTAKARDVISDWIKDTNKKVPIGGEKLAKVIREVSDAGAKIFKEGRKLISDSVELAEQNIKPALKKLDQTKKGKNSTNKGLPAKKRLPSKKLIPRKNSSRKTIRSSTTSEEAKLPPKNSISESLPGNPKN